MGIWGVEVNLGEAGGGERKENGRGNVRDEGRCQMEEEEGRGKREYNVGGRSTRKKRGWKRRQV